MIKRKRWTEQEDKILLDSLNNKLTKREIAKLLPDRTIDSIVSRKRIVSPSTVKSVVWEKSKIDYLNQNYLELSPKKLAENLGIGYTTTIEKLKELNLYQANAGYRIWTIEETQYLEDNYLFRTYYDIARKLKRTTSSVTQKANLLGLKKESNKNWTEEQLTFLKENYSKMSLTELIHNLKKSSASIIHNARKLNLGPINAEFKRNRILYVIENAKFKSDKEIANELDISEDAVSTIRKNNNIYKNSNPSTQENFIEKKVKEELETYDIEFINNQFLGPYKPDFYIPKLNLVIEVQGDYWHCNPEIYKDGPKNQDQVGYIINDYYKKCYYIGNGYKLVYIWENDILKNFTSVQHKIKELLETAVSRGNFGYDESGIKLETPPCESTGQSETEG